ncbi:hypothetical protein [Streptomyces bobili]|uniref:hypothetical protein n=1 Tax=Streptomyces bobili TaxID=67280 RepID=UPI003F6166DE
MERLREISTTARGRAGDSFGAHLDAVARAYVDCTLANAALLDLMYALVEWVTMVIVTREGDGRCGSHRTSVPWSL